jgi:hypothetical protein
VGPQAAAAMTHAARPNAARIRGIEARMSSIDGSCLSDLRLVDVPVIVESPFRHARGRVIQLMPIRLAQLCTTSCRWSVRVAP